MACWISWKHSHWVRNDENITTSCKNQNTTNFCIRCCNMPHHAWPAVNFFPASMFLYFFHAFMFYVGLLIVRLCFMNDIVLFIDWLYCIDLFSCIGASVFNKLTYLLTMCLITMAANISEWCCTVAMWGERCWIHTHPFNGPFPGLPRWAGTRKVKPIWNLPKQETVSGSGISWAICKSAPHSRQTTTPAPHHSVFYRPDVLPAAQPTASKHWRLQSTEHCWILPANVWQVIEVAPFSEKVYHHYSDNNTSCETCLH